MKRVRNAPAFFVKIYAMALFLKIETQDRFEADLLVDVLG